MSAIVTTIFGLALFGSIYFIPLFVQGVIGTTATSSGVILTPLMLTSMVSSIISGQLVARSGKYKWVAILGMVISVIGILLLVRLNANSTNIDVLVSLLIMGFGMGFSMALYTLIVQNAMPERIGQATSALIFFRQIGSTLGLAAMGSLLTSAFQPGFQKALSPTLRTIIAHLPAKVQPALANPQVLLSPEMQQQLRSAFTTPHPGSPFDPAQGAQLYTQLIEAVKQGLAQSIHSIFLLNAGFIILALIAVFFLKEVKLRDRKRSDIVTEAAEQGVENLAPEGMSSMGMH